MIVLDTDVLSLVQRDDSPLGLKVRSRIAQLPPGEQVGVTIITYQEQVRGWLAFIAKARSKPQQIQGYALLNRHLDLYRQAFVVPFDSRAADTFDELRVQYPRLGAMDLRIAAIAISRDALVVTRNIVDFSKIANLKVEDWTR